MAINCWVVPAAMRGLMGATEIELRVAELTVRVMLAEMPPEVAVMYAVPALTLAASPVALTDAIARFEELQPTCVVISKLVPSE